LKQKPDNLSSLRKVPVFNLLREWMLERCPQMHRATLSTPWLFARLVLLKPRGYTKLSNMGQTLHGISDNIFKDTRLFLRAPAGRGMTIENDKTERPMILVVDDKEQVRTSLKAVLEVNQFRVTTAANVTEALHLIDTKPFDVLISDLHMPEAGDGFTLVSAMRHTNPDAVTLVYTGYPELEQAMGAILLQADEVLVKPMEVPKLVAIIHEKLENRELRHAAVVERVAAILERNASAVVAEWLARVEREAELTSVHLNEEARTGHLPKLLQELVRRLRTPRSLGTKAVSKAAVEHGRVRHSQGYSVPMIVEESRILQVSIFETLQKNLNTVDFSLLLIDVMTIADECDSQLKQTLTSFMRPELVDCSIDNASTATI
jgi:DNA-binding response OmpR family regulator